MGTRKERYYTIENIHRKSEMLLREISSYLRNSNFEIKNSALIVIDAQRLFFEKESKSFVPSTPAIVPNIRALIKLYGQKNRPVIFTRHIDDSENSGLMKTWWKKLTNKSDPASQLFFDSRSHLVIEKSQYDAFYQTDLEKILRKNKAKRVVICGVTTDLCCESTARSAFIRGFEVYFPIDATATKDYELHKASIMTLSHGFVYPVLTKEIIGE